jgi:hypothetical protein
MSLNEVQAPAEPVAVAADAVSYEDLYARWERGHWSATELDFAEDRRQWQRELTEFERRAALWNYALFLWGEDAVADTLSPYIDAAPREEQKYLLATQQVDEARHAIFFKRFVHEVAGLGAGDARSALAAIRPQLTWGVRRVFSRLHRMAAELRRDPSPRRLAAAVALYHVVIEATLAQPGQHMIERALERRRLLPAFRAGIARVGADEQRHIGFGVKLLSELVREEPRAREDVAALLRQVVPWLPCVLDPPGGDRRYTEVFDFTLEEVAELGMRSLEGRLRAAGLALERLPGPPPLPLDLAPPERARYGLALRRAGIVGPKDRAAPRDRATAELLFGTIARSVDPRVRLRRPLTVQWELADLEPWHLRVRDGTATAAPGRAADPTLTLRVGWQDWVDVVARRRDPRGLALTGRLRVRGDLRALPALRRLLAR